MKDDRHPPSRTRSPISPPGPRFAPCASQNPAMYRLSAIPALPWSGARANPRILPLNPLQVIKTVRHHQNENACRPSGPENRPRPPSPAPMPLQNKCRKRPPVNPAPQPNPLASQIFVAASVAIPLNTKNVHRKTIIGEPKSGNVFTFHANDLPHDTS